MAKIKITLSKGPQGVQGPQGPQGPLGPAGPQGIQGQPGVDGTIIDNINDIDNVGLDLNTANLVGTNIEGLGLLSPKSNRYLTWDPVDNIIKLSEDTPGTYLITGASGSPSPGNQFVNPIFASTNGGNVPNVFAASGVISVNQSSQIPSSVNLYVNGNARFNGAIQVGDVNGVSYSLPSADGTAGQLLQTDGAGSVSFVSFSGSPWTTTGSDIYYNTGNVGIGTATPNQPLAVTGNIQASEYLIFGGTSEFAPSVKSVTNNGIHIGQSTGTSLANAGVVIGTNAGRFNSGVYNTAIGPNAGYRGSYSLRQTSVGSHSNSGGAAYAKNYSVGVGVNSNYNGSDNTTSVGAYTGNNSPSSYTNSAFFGYQAGHSGGNNSVFVGYEAGKSDGVQLVSDTVAVGYQALTALTTGTGNTAVGYQSGVALTTGANNTFLGYGVGLAATDLSDNVLIGKDVAPSSTTINKTIAIGNSALYSATTAGVGGSVFIGHEVGKNITTASASNNVYIGYQAGLSRNGQYEKVAIGASAGTGGSSNIAIGRNSMNIGGSNSLGIGHSVGANNSGADAVIIGSSAGAFGATTESVLVGNRVANSSGGNYSVMMGHRANQGGTSHNSVHVGHSSGRENDGDSNVAVGYQTISETTTGSTISNSVAVGYQALKGTTTSTASGVVAVGYEALTALTTGGNNTAVGYQASVALTTGAQNTTLGYHAGLGLTIGSKVTAIGYQAGQSTTGSNSDRGQTFVGWRAGHDITSGADGVTAVGSQARGKTNGSYMTMIGTNSYSSNTYGTVVGHGAENSGYGLSVGARAGNTSAGGTYLGYRAGYNATGAGNVIVGNSAGDAGGSYSNTVAIGDAAGGALTTGGSNILIGYQAGSTLTTESNKLYIENSASTTPLIYGEFDNDILRVNGTLQVNDPASTGYALPAATGTTGQALVVNASGDVEFGDVGIDGFVTEVAADSIKGWQYERGQWVDTSANISLGINLSSGEGHPSDVFLSPDGTSLYMLGWGMDRLYQWTLNTAFDLKTVDLNSEKWVYLGSGTPMALYIADDPSDLNTYGKKFFVLHDNSNKVREFLATTAWDITTIDNIGNQGTPSENASYTLTEGPDHYYDGMCFSTDGSKMFISRNSASTPDVQVYDLSVNYDITSVSYNVTQSIDFSNVYYPQQWYGNQDIGTGGTFSKATNIEFNTDGTKLYLVTDFSRVHELNLSTPYDVTTYTHVDTINFLYQSLPGLQLADGDGRNHFLSDLNGMHYVKNANYVFFMYGSGDEITRLKRDNVVISNATFFQDSVSVDRNLSTTNFVSAGFADINASVFRGAPYFNQAMNWSGFNSGPAVTKGNTFILGPSMRTLHFTDNTNPAALSGPTTHDINNTNAGTFIMVTDNSSANNIILPASSGTVLLDTTPGLYFNAFDTEAGAKVTGATEDIEYYYTARADGQGKFQRQIGALPASGQTLTRTSYYSNKAFADPDTASDWTVGTAYTSTSLASSISQSTDTLLNAQATGTPPLSTKIVISNYLGSSGFLSGDANGFGGSSVVYGLRLLNHAYGGAAIRVVNDSGVEADIGFNSSYELDTSALLTHCGSGDGYLVKWYDQAKVGNTGDGNDATWESSTSYSSRKPQIVSAGSVITDNGKPCLETIDAGMLMESEFNASGEYDAFIVCQKTINNGNHGMLFGTQTGNDNRIWMRDNTLNLQVDSGATDIGGLNDDGSSTLRFYQLGQMVLNVRRDASGINSVQRNAVVGSSTYTNGGAFRGDRILNSWNNQQYSFGGNVQEIIMLDGDKSSERSAILSNLNTYYSVY